MGWNSYQGNPLVARNREKAVLLLSPFYYTGGMPDVAYSL